jgi:hypothetical protein
MKMRRWASAVAIALSLSACSKSHGVGSFARNGQLVFEISDSPPVSEISVDQISARTYPVWRITSVARNGQKLNEISYNHTPFGFVESVPVQPLRAGQLYRVSIVTTKGREQADFVISDDRRVLDVSS